MFKKLTTKIFALICIAMFALTSIPTGASAATESHRVFTKAPRIEVFNTSSENVAPGETVQLTWRVLGAKSVEITGEEKEIECVSEGSLEVWPMATTEYTLHAYGFNGEEVTKTVLVKVGASNVKAPVIINFTSNKTEITKGETAILSWNVLYAKSVKIVGIEKQPESDSNSIEVWPLTTTTYTLVVEGYDGSQITQDLTVYVKDSLIGSFTASKTEITKGEMIKLSWTTNNAASCYIETSDGSKLKNTPLNGSISVTPNKDTTFTLVVTDKNGNVKRQSINIRVVKY